MSRIAELKKNLDEYRAAELTASALEDLSAMRLAGIRSGFERNRTFYAGIRDLYGIVRKFGETKNPIEKPKEKKQLFVALTSNKRFYGSLMREVIAALARSLAQLPSSDALVVGRAGWQYVEQMNLTKQVRQMILEEDMPSAEEFDKLLDYFSQFDRVLVLYPKFINPFRQDVGIEDITQSPERAIPDVKQKDEAAAVEDAGPTYIFEPESSAILSFFDAQVQRVLLQGVLLEAELARTAARLLRLEEAQARAHELAQRGEFRVRRESAAISDAELLETFAGLATWRRI